MTFTDQEKFIAFADTPEDKCQTNIHKDDEHDEMIENAIAALRKTENIQGIP